jgi:tetratricopeptide (TPR) repeat protein
MSHTIGQTRQDDWQSDNPSLADLNSSKLDGEASRSVPTLSDADYEFLFNQLLEGIAHGWHDRRIVKFFVRLGNRGRGEDWIAWLQRLQAKASNLPLQSKRHLGTMMIRLGELTRATPEVAEIGAASYRIGKKLLFDQTPIIWEYIGPDLPSRHKIETEPELSTRLPTDFTALGSGKSPKKANEASLATENAITEHQELNENSSNGSKVQPDLDLSIDEIVASSTLSADLNLEPNGDRQKNTDELKLPEESETLKSSTNLSDFPTSIDDIAPIPEEDLADETKDLEDSLSIDRTPQITAAYSGDSQAMDIARVMNLIQEDEELAQQILQKLNPNTAQSEITAPELDPSSLELIESWFNLGLKQVSAGELTQAIASWEKALSINPNLSEAWHNRGSALGRLGDYQTAVESFQNALTIDPNNYQAWNDRAHALYQLENWLEAVNSWSEAIKIMPGNHVFWYSRGCALEQLERWDEAIASHEKALEIAPDFQPGRSRYINLIADNSRSN